mmetsp:Transcript_96309/g.281367  ORF Transcript_96309/g.281367 Transcript_96309/m.281367 type:complete len:216 (+) Transcript_96309:167-814(+)
MQGAAADNATHHPTQTCGGGGSVVHFKGNSKEQGHEFKPQKLCASSYFQNRVVMEIAKAWARVSGYLKSRPKVFAPILPCWQTTSFAPKLGASSSINWKFLGEDKICLPLKSITRLSTSWFHSGGFVVRHSSSLHSVAAAAMSMQRFTPAPTLCQECCTLRTSRWSWKVAWATFGDGRSSLWCCSSFHSALAGFHRSVNAGLSGSWRSPVCPSGS